MATGRMWLTGQGQESWAVFYWNVFLGVCELDLRRNGPRPEYERAVQHPARKPGSYLQVGIPHVLEPLQVNGRKLNVRFTRCILGFFVLWIDDAFLLCHILYMQYVEGNRCLYCTVSTSRLGRHVKLNHTSHSREIRAADTQYFLQSLNLLGRCPSAKSLGPRFLRR